MSAILQFVLQHGYSILFAALFTHQIGFPIPGPMFLLAAGALAAAGKLDAFVCVGLTIVACVLADWIWYEAGRLRGDRVLTFMHRFTRDPAFHNRRAKETFARYGLPVLLVVKFIPGVDAVVPPLAGTSHTSRVKFLFLDAVGAGLYACVYGGLGFVFSHDLDRAASYVARAGRFMLALIVIAACAYMLYRLLRRYRMVPDPHAAQASPVDSAKTKIPVAIHGVIPQEEPGD